MATKDAKDTTAIIEAKFIGPGMLEADCPRCDKHLHLKIKRKSKKRATSSRKTQE